MSEQTQSSSVLPKAENNLTFGVEIEFILATRFSGKPDPHPQDPRDVDCDRLSDETAINYDILEKLKAVGIPAIVYGVGLEHEREEFETCWVLKEDASVGPAGFDEGDYQEYGLEMSSPPYYYTESAQNAIITVLKTVRNNYRVRVDNTTGLHVHVGNSYHGLQFPILQKLLAIAYTYEPQILLMFPAERQLSQWCPPLSQSEFVKRNPDLTRAQVLEKILAYTDNSSLLDDFGVQKPWGRLAFNIGNLETPYESGKRTIEFRQHHGSLDPKAILNWMHVCVKFVEKACLAKDDELFVRLRQDISKPTGLDEDQLSPVDFLMWLGCPAQAYYYGINMVVDKVALKERIANDTMTYKNELERLRSSLLRRQQLEEFQRGSSLIESSSSGEGDSNSNEEKISEKSNEKSSERT